MSYIIEQIPIDDVFKYDKLKYNTNNHWEKNGRPLDYINVLEQSYLSKWINNFREYKLISIDDENHIKWLKEVSKLCSITNRFSTLYEEDLDDFLKHYTKYNNLFKGNGYFVRCENVSLKYGEFGNIPFTNLKDIIKACVTCPETHSPITQELKTLKIYIFDWININPNLEFRVFVNNNKITSISQQNLYSRNQILYEISQEYDYMDDKTHCLTYNQSLQYEKCIIHKNKIITTWCDTIQNYFTNEIIPKITHTTNYTMDIALLQNSQGLCPYLIEINSFGKEYSAGSALFHWIIDETKLYDCGGSNIYFRYCR